jgi:tetratricopeptide (TPR) repeat protein
MTNEADLPGFNYLTKLFLDGALEELSSELERFLCADPSNLDGLNLLGLLEKKKGNVNEARKIFENLCERHPNSVGVLSNLGNLIAEQGNSTSAIAIFIKALALKPGKSQAEIIFKGLGLAQKSLGLDKEAIKSFKKGLRLRGPLNAELQLEIAHIYRKREDYYQAITAFDRIDIRASKIHQLECIYRIKDTTLFKEKLVALAGERKPNPC